MSNAVFILSLFFTSYAKAAIKEVFLGFIEPIDTADSTSSIRYKEQFEGSIFYSVGQIEKQLNKCGYSLLVERAFHPASDQLAGAREAGRLLKEGAWVVHGPRRSEDILKISKVIEGKIPLIGPMAESKEFTNAHPLNLTMYPAAKEFSDLAFKIAKRKNFGQTYGVVVDASCPACVEFAKSFDEAALKQKLRKVFEVGITKDNIQSTTTIHAQVDFVIVPNSSRVSSQVVSELSKRGISKKFIGSNGWGDEFFGYFSTSPIGKDVKGFAVRAGLSPEAMKKTYNVNSLSFKFGDKTIGPSYSSFNVIFFIKRLSHALCNFKPKNREDFAKAMSKLPKNFFKFESGLRSVEISEGKLISGQDFPK